jgi:uncharacterized RDD family membrane protein YckC
LTPAGHPVADFGTRLVAIVIDAAVIGFASFVLMIVAILAYVEAIQPLIPKATIDPKTGEPALSPEQISTIIPWMLGAFVVIFVAVLYVYQVELMFRRGQTLGKRVMKIAIVPLDPTRRLSRGMAAKRFLVETVAGLFVPLLYYVDGLWQLWDQPYHQCLHDKFAQTIVIKT